MSGTLPGDVPDDDDDGDAIGRVAESMPGPMKGVRLLEEEEEEEDKVGGGMVVVVVRRRRRTDCLLSAMVCGWGVGFAEER